MAAFRERAIAADPRPGRQGQGDLRPLRRRRFLGRGRAAARGDRRPAHLRLRRPRPAARRTRRSRSCACSATTTTSRWSTPTPRELFLGELAGVTDPEQQAQDHRRAVHRRVRGGGEEDRRRRVPGPGHALSRRDRIGVLHRRPVGHDQEPPQCRRPARAHEHEAGRAAARTVQGRGARARPRARPARATWSAAIRSPARASPSASPATSRARSSTSCARSTRSISTRSARPASTTRSGRPSPCCCRCAPSA